MTIGTICTVLKDEITLFSSIFSIFTSALTLISGFFTNLTLILITLKIIGIIKFSWFWVLSPMIALIILGLICAIGVLILVKIIKKKLDNLFTPFENSLKVTNKDVEDLKRNTEKNN